MDRDEALGLLRGGKEDVAEWNERREDGEEIPDLSGAKLFNANLSGAKLFDAVLFDADLSHADLSGAKLSKADLSYARLSDADLSDADLSNANLSDANLSNADLSNANLSEADLNDANLSGANLSGANGLGATLGDTNLIDTDLTPFCDVELEHDYPSVVDWRSIAKSLKAPGLEKFLIDCGMPVVVATYLIDCCHSIDPEEMFSMLQSTFISYGGSDEEFARKLREALERNGSKTWFFPEDAEPGEKLHRVMRRGIENNDRVILICSKSSLNRGGVLAEIEFALAKEANEGGRSLLIPIAIDDYVYSEWTPEREDLAMELRRRVVGDFRDETKFDENIGKLLKALERRKQSDDPASGKSA